jgi:F-type H+-transporting ATPase subunit b
MDFLLRTFANEAVLLESFVVKFDRDFIMGVLFQLFNTALIIGILTRFLYSPVKKYLNDRSERIRKMLERAEEDSAAAAELKEEYEKIMASVAIERDSILNKANESGLRREEQIVQSAKRDAIDILARVDRDIELEREKAKDEIKRQIAEVSVLIAGKYITGAMDDAEQKRIFDEAMSGLEASQW